MILHLVTDRRRLCPDSDELTRRACLLEQARAGVDAGIDVIQIRERDLDGGPLAELTAQFVLNARGSATRIVVNERLDVALVAGAHGVHLRGTSFDAVRVRAVAPEGFLIGRSVHTVTEVQTAGPVDYLMAGTVWATSSKPEGHPLLGLEGLSTLVAASPVPVVGIGGIELSRVPALASTGAAGIAGISIFHGGNEGGRAASLRRTVQLLRHEAVRAANI